MAERIRSRRALGRGPGRVLVVVYGVFAVSAGARAGFQLATGFAAAPVAYALSGLAAAVYLVATVALVRSTGGSWRVAVAALSVELAGVLGVGTASVLVPSAFPDATVWSDYGSGYGYVPLVLPVLGLLWLRRTAPTRGSEDGAAT